MDALQPRAGRHYPRSIGEFQSWFGTDADCLDYLEWLRWPEGFVCLECGCPGGWATADGRDGRYKCAGCGSRTSVTAGTLFPHRRTPLTVWFTACWTFAAQKDGVLALHLQRALEIGPYPTVWAMLHRLRSVLVRPGPGPAERHGGGRRDLHRRRGAGAARRASEGQEGSDWRGH
ncbi:MAG: transposase [Acidimicrobiales bacterium]